MDTSGLAQNSSQTPFSLASYTIIGSSSWLEKLVLNILSYSVVIFPIAFIVITTKYRLCPTPFQNSVVIQWFVHGYVGESNSQQNSRLNYYDEDSKSLLPDDGRRTRTETKSKSGNIYQFLWCLIGLQFSYLIWGVLQEKIMTTKYPSTIIAFANESNSTMINNEASDRKTFISFHDSQFLVFINRIVAFILSILALVYNHNKHTKSHMNQLNLPKLPAPLYIFIYSAMSNILSSWCQYEALKYVDFPTQVLSKSFKVVPVMLMSSLVMRKKYQPFDYGCALVLSLGMFAFLFSQPAELTNHHHHPDSARSFNSTNNQLNFHEMTQQVRNSSLASGLTILALYLVFDSFTSNWQQKLFSQYDTTKWQMMAASNFYSILLTLTSLYQLGNLGPAFKLLSQSNPLLWDCLLMSIMSSIGQLFIFYTIQTFGSVVFAIIMTLRQFLSILLSCAIYGHRLSFGSGFGIVLMFCVALVQTWKKSSESSKMSKTTSQSLSKKSSWSELKRLERQ